MAIKPAFGTAINTSDPLASGLILYWALLQGSTTTAVDSSVSADNGTLTPGTGAIAWGTDAAGDPIVQITTAGAYLRNSVVRNLPNITVAIDVRVPVLLSSARRIAGCLDGTGSSNTDQSWRMTTGDLFQFNMWDGSQVRTITDASNPGANTWRQFVATSTTTQLRGYRDSVEMAGSPVSTGTHAVTYATPNLLFGGADTAYAAIALDLRWMAVWDRALTGAEVTRLFTDPYTLFTPAAPTGPPSIYVLFEG